MHNGLSAEDVRAALDLTPHATCDYVRLTYIAKNEIGAGGMAPPFADRRPAGSGLYFNGDAGRAGAAASHPERPVLSL